jgi:hypothetical protein
MSILYNALNELKKDIAEIKKVLPEDMKRNTQGLDKVSDSKQKFVNPALLPPEIKMPIDAVVPENSNYSDNILQAVWNIADIASNLDVLKILKLFKDPKALTQNFDYLDSSWVPQIIDSKTHRTGLALIKFLDKILESEKVFAEEPFSNLPTFAINRIKDDIINELNSMKKDLQERIKVYETYTPENLASNISSQQRMDKLKVEREIGYKTLIEDNIIDLKNKISENKKVRKVPLSLETLQTNLKLLVDQRDLLKDKFDEFEKSNTERVKNNEDFTTIESNKFFNTLYGYQTIREAQGNQLPEYLQNDQEEKIIGYWQHLYSTNLQSEDINVRKELTKHDASDSKSINKALQEADEQIILLKEKIIATERLESFTQDFQSNINNSLAPMIYRPSCIITVDGIPGLEIKESQNQNIELALQENIEAYGNALPKELKTYSEELSAYRNYLEEQFSDLQNKITIPENLPKGFDLYYKQIPQDIFNPRIQKVDEELALVKGLSQEAKEKKNTFESDLAKLSAAGKQNALRDAGNRVQTTFNAQREARYTDIKVSAERSDFIQDHYNPAIEDINDLYNPKISKINAQIDTTKESMKRFEATANKRRAFLVEAKKELNQYKNTLLASTGLYIQADKIPQNKLLDYLELGPESTESIKIAQMYSSAETGNSWYGINLSNISTRVSTYASGINSFDLIKKELEKTIDKKLEQFDEELKIKGLTAKVEKTKTTSENHLSIISSFYQNLQKKLEEQTLLKTEMIAEKQGKIDPWDDLKSQHDQKVLRFNLNTQLKKVDNQLAVIALDSLNLEYKLDEIEEKLPVDSIEDSVSIDDLLEKNQNSLELITTLFSEEKTKELHKKISNNLTDQHLDLKLLEELERSKLTESMQEKLEFVENELKSLDKKNTALEKKITTIDEKILAIKSVIAQLQLKKLAEIEKEYIELTAKMIEFIETNPTEATFAEAALTLDERLEKNKDFLNQCQQSQNQSVREDWKQIDIFATTLRDLRDMPVFNEEIEQNEEPFDFKEEKEPAVFPKLIVPIKQQINELKEIYFSQNKKIEDISGKFGDYLTNRNKVHWFKDLFSGLAAMVFGIDYKSPAQERADYLVELHQKMNIFQAKPGYYTFETIVAKIEEGQKKFSPEAETGESYDISLSELLSSLKVEFETIEKEPHKELAMAEPENEEEEAASIKPR